MESPFENKPINPNMLAFKAALMYSFYFLVLLFIFNWININQGDPNAPVLEKGVSLIASWGPFVIAILYVQTTFKKELGGFISFGRAFSTGFKVAAYSGLFLAILTVLYYKVLDKAAFEKMIDTALTGAGDDENKRKGIEMMRPYMTFLVAFGTAVAYTFFGLVISLISAAVIKKEQPLFFASEE